MDMNETDIVEYLNQHAASFLTKEEYINFKKLQDSAHNFLQNIQMKVDEIQNYDRLLGYGNRRGLNTVITKIRSNMKKDEVARSLIKYQILFEKELNDFLGRKIYLTYVFSDGTVGFYDEIKQANLFQKNAVGSQGRGKMYHTNMQRTFNTFAKNLRQQAKTAIQNKKNVYTEALRRYHKQAGSGSGQMRYKQDVGSDNFYWWLNVYKTDLRWSNSIPDEGRIAQGYINFVFNSDNNNIYGAYNSQKIDLNFENGLIALNDSINNQRDQSGNFDWIAAIVKGDIVLKSNEDIQFAVKTNDFNSGAIGPYIRFAYNISQVAYLSKQFIKNHLIQLSSGISKSSKGAKVINQAKKQLIEKLTPQMQKAVK